jgi:GTP pyrophosphokinase
MVKVKLALLDPDKFDLPAWLDRIKNEYHFDDVSWLEKAIHFTQEISAGQDTFYNQPYFFFALSVVEIILNLKLKDLEMITAGLIASTTPLTAELKTRIKKEFGEEILKIITNVQQMGTLPGLQPQQRDKHQVEKIRKMLLAMAADIRVVIIKLAERLCFIRNIKHIDHVARKTFASEILDIYAPLANRLGIGQLKWELEDIAFHYLDPIQYKKIAGVLAERRVDREKRIENIMHVLNDKLTPLAFEFKVTGRPKHIYSIYLESARKDVSYQEIYDSNAVRILVPSIQDCYAVLSIVHSLWQPFMKEFDDYVAHPKDNGYRSIHTTLIGEDNHHFEIQIRTFAMHEEAERGIAAHWAYKESQTDKNAKISYLHQLLDWHQEVETKSDTKKIDDEIYVITPMGEILNLPQGATPLDFAYHIHSELGHRCRGAKVNGQIVPLTYTLRTGDKVEIMTIIQGHPSRDWLNEELGYVKTTRAKNKISHWFRQQELQEDLENGRHLLERELAKHGLAHTVSLIQIARQLNLKDEDALFFSLARGNVRLMQIMQLIRPHKTTADTAAPTPHSLPTQANAGASIVGSHDLLTRMSKCCKPIPGDQIVGYITQGRGISIHKKTCTNIHSLINSARFIDVAWNSQTTNVFNTDLKIIASQEKNILQDITALFSNEKITLLHLQTTFDNQQNQILIVASLQVQHIEELHRLVHRIGQMPSVVSVKRVAH